MVDNYKGYSLFNDVVDDSLRTRNRAVVMSNMYEDHPHNSDRNATSKTGALLIFGYMQSVTAKERAVLVTEFHEQMKLRGFDKA